MDEFQELRENPKLMELAKAAAEKTTMSADEIVQYMIDGIERQQEFLEKAYESFIRSLMIPKLTAGQKREAVFRAILDGEFWNG